MTRDIILAGYRGTAIAGDYQEAHVGDSGHAVSGYAGTSIAGEFGTAAAGERGQLIIEHWSTGAGAYVNKIEIVGENGIKANTPYRLDKKGNFIEAEGNTND